MSDKDKLDLWFAKTENEDVGSKVGSLWRDKDGPFVDLAIRVLKYGGEEETWFNAHKLILGMSSPVFAYHLFGNRLKEATTSQQCVRRTVLKIKRYSPSTFKMILEFMYTSSVVLPQEPELTMEAIGGLLCAAKRYKINKLAEFCFKKLKKDLTHEKALENFDKLLDPKSCTPLKISHNKELLKYYFAYILRNGKDVLHTNRFQLISVSSLEWICNADFLCASELTVYRAIFWWARERCRGQKLKDTAKNRRRMLQITEDSLGIMKCVRFTSFDSFDFTVKVDRTDQRYQLLPANLVEKLYKVFVLEESTNLCCTTPRTNDYEDDTTNKQYVDAFVEKKVYDLLSKPVNIQIIKNKSPGEEEMARNSTLTDPVDSQTPAAPISFVTETPKSKTKTTSTSGNSSDTGISSVESESFLAEDQEKDSSKKVVKEASNPQEHQPNKLPGEPLTENITGDSIHLVATVESHFRRMLFVSPQKDDAFPIFSSPILSDLSSPGSEKSADKIVQPCIFNPVAISQSPSFTNDASTTFKGHTMSQASGGLNSHSTPRATSSSASQPTYCKSSSVDPKKKATLQLPVQPKKPRKRVYKENNESATPVTKSRKVHGKAKSSSNEANTYDIRKKVMTYQDIINDCSESNKITEYILNDSVIREFKKRSSCFKSVHMPYLTNFSVEFHSCDTRTKVALIKDLSEISLEHYIFFYSQNKDPNIRLTDLWGRKVNVKLSFSGISVFEMCPKNEKLVINYTKNSSFLRLNQMKVNNLKSLNLANCTIQQKNWLNADCSKHLTELRLFCVKTLKCQDIIKECTNLQHLSIWPATVGAKLSLNDLNASELLSLAANNVVITFNVKDIKPFNSMKAICFQDCTWDEDFINNFSKLFPNLRQISVSSKYCQPGPDLLRVLTQMKSVKFITVWNFDLKRLEQHKFEDLKVFLRELGIQKSGKECHFKLKREINTKWKGCNANFEKQSSQVYDLFGLSKFYSIEMWKKIWSNLV